MHSALQNQTKHFEAKGGDKMKKCIFHGYSFSHAQIRNMNDTAKEALDAILHSSIQEFADDLSTDDIGNMMIERFTREYPDFNLIDGKLEFLN